jgi:hypothetical protein
MTADLAQRYPALRRRGNLTVRGFCMADFLWLLYPIFWSLVGVWLVPGLTRPRRIVVIILVVVGVPLAYRSYRSQLALNNHITSVDNKLSDPKTGLVAISNRLNQSGIQNGILAGELAPYLKPSLKKDALELGSTLSTRAGEILSLAAQHGAVDPETLPVKAFPESLQFKTMQKQWNDQQAAHERSLKQRAELMDDYENNYASKVVALRQGFINQGLDWKNEQYYSNPTDVHEIANVGMDLIIHANRLK